MAVVALFGLVFALGHYVGLYGAAIAVLVILCIGAHVAGNAIGTRLRDGDATGTPDGARQAALARVARRPVAPAEFAPTTRLRGRYSLGRPIVVITALGSLFSGIAGGLGLFWLTGARSPWTVIALGAAASAVLGAIWTFAAASFIQVTAGAWFHAANGRHKP